MCAYVVGPALCACAYGRDSRKHSEWCRSGCSVRSLSRSHSPSPSSLSLSLGGGPRATPSPRRGRRPLAPLHPPSLAPTMAANAQDSQAPLRGQEFKKDEDREDDGVLFFKRGGGRASGALIEQARAARRAGGAYGRAGRCPTLQPGPGRLIGWLPLARWRSSTAPVGGRGARRKERRRAGGRDPRRSPSFLSSRPRRVSPPSLPSLPPSESFQSSTPPSTASKRGWSCRRPASSTTPTLTPASASR